VGTVDAESSFSPESCFLRFSLLYINSFTFMSASIFCVWKDSVPEVADPSVSGTKFGYFCLNSVIALSDSSILSLYSES